MTSGPSSVSSATPATPAVAARPAVTTAPLPAHAPGYSTPPASIHYGGFWIRFIAAVIDGILVQVIVLPLSFLLGALIGVASFAVKMPAGGAQIVAMIIGLALGTLGAWIYEAALESSSRQATVGKMIFGLMVTDLEGNRISFGRATGRYFGKYVSGLTLFIGYIMAGFTERKQALHDMLAGTLVRYRR